MKRTKVSKISEIARTGRTFDAMYSKIEEKMDISKLTSVQIAQILELMAEQKEHGSNQMWKEIHDQI